MNEIFRRKTRVKHTLFTLVLLFIVYCMSEAISFGILRNVTTVQEKDWGIRLHITDKFPAQLRMSHKEILQDFPSISIMPRAGQHLSFEFDPVLGYKKLSNQQWYGGTINDLEGKFLIVCFGGSTTQLDNWPKYLQKYMKAAGVKEDVVVLNAGLAGYMTFNEKIYFAQWILPMLEKVGKTPDLVLTLDGANDVWYRILSYELSQREGTSWYDRYHGYHQEHDKRMRQLRSFYGGLRQFTANSLAIIREGAIHIAPYTMRTLEYLARRFIGRNQATTENIREPESTKLPRNVEQKIVAAFRDTLIDFYGLAEVRNIDFVAYLQPVVLEEYYPHPMPKENPFKGIDWLGFKNRRANSAFSQLYSNRLISTSAMFRDADITYAQLNKIYPGHFKSLISLFKENPDSTNLYKNDSIHYNQLGKEIIAEKVVDDLIEKRILTVN